MANSQALARTALYRAREASDNLGRANAALDEEERQRQAAEAAAAASSGPAGFRNTPQVTLGPSWTGLRDEATDDLDAARRLFAAACQDYRDAARTCAHDLGQAIDDHLKDHQRGFLSGLGHAISTGIHGLEAATSWVDHHLPSIDQVSEVLGVAAAVASLTGCEPLALALTGAKTLVDVGQALAGEGDWSKVREDAFGLALFGAGRVLTGYARARAGAAAAIDAARASAAADKARSGLAAAKDAETAANLSEDLRTAQTAAGRYSATAKSFVEDARTLSQKSPSRYFTQSIRMFKDIHAELPAAPDLMLSKRALLAGAVKTGVDVYGKGKDVYEVGAKVEEVDEAHPTFIADDR